LRPDKLGGGSDVVVARRPWPKIPPRQFSNRAENDLRSRDVEARIACRQVNVDVPAMVSSRVPARQL